jgi:hypothetical protein
VSDEPEQAQEIDYGPAFFEPAAEAGFRPPAHVDLAATYDALWRKQPQVPGFIQFARNGSRRPATNRRRRLGP